MMRLLLFFILSTISTIIFSFTSLRIDFALDRQDNETARRLLQQRLVADSTDASAAYNLGQLYYQAGDFAKASTYFATAAEQEGADVQLRLQATYQRGNSLVKQEKYHDALRAFESVIALQPQHEAAHAMIEAIKKLLEEQKQKHEQSKDEQQEKNDQKDQSKADQDGEKQDNNIDSPQNKSEQSKNKNDEKNQQNNTKKDNDSSEKNQKNQEENSDKQHQSSGTEQKKESESDSDKKNNPSDARGLEQNKQSSESAQTGSKNQQALEKKKKLQADSSKTVENRAAFGEAAQKNEKNLKDDTVQLLQFVEGHDNAVAKRLLQGDSGEKKSAGYKNW